MPSGSLVPLQLRMASFGVFYLYLPLIVLAAAAMRGGRGHGTRIWRPRSIALCAAYYPTVRYQLFRPEPARGGACSLRPCSRLLPVLRDACAQDPGVVLAEPGDGHMIRYFTKCSVIANNFRLTPLDVAKVQRRVPDYRVPVEQVRLSAPT